MKSRFIVLVALIVGSVVLAVSRVAETSSTRTQTPGNAHGPVVVELFTSEGCSSCPPADGLLRRLHDQSSPSGTQLIVLGWHVDYWDRLGWKDRFSSPDFTRRQQQYSEAFANDQVYTPQMIVDGRNEFVGNDETKARAAIIHAAENAKAAVSLSVKRLSPQRIQIQADIRDLPKASGDVRVLLLLAEDNLSSDVRAGENQGHQLQHVAVVRQVRMAGNARPGQDNHQQAEFDLEKQWKVGDLKAVLLLQDPRTYSVLGAASIPLR